MWLGTVTAITASLCLALLLTGVCAKLPADRTASEALNISVARQEHVLRSLVMATAPSLCLIVLQTGAGFNLPIAHTQCTDKHKVRSKTWALRGRSKCGGAW